MSSWADKYREIISSNDAPHVIVADNDNLLAYDELQKYIQDEGFQILHAKSGLDVRCLFELQMRDNPDKILIVAPPQYKPLPDITSSVRYLSLGLKELFPNLDSESLRGLSFNALCLLSNIRPYEELGRERTLKFLLENLYNVDFDTLSGNTSRERILNALIMVFLEKNGINASLAAFLENLARPYLPDLVAAGLTKINLVDYLQRSWNEYLETGSSKINFQDTVLSKSFGYLFIFDYLKPAKVSREKADALPKVLHIAICVDEEEDRARELEALIQYLEQQESIIEDDYQQWFKIIQVLAKAELSDLAASRHDQSHALSKVNGSLNERFQRFLDNTYWSLFSLSGVRRPVVISRVLEYMKAQPERRKALIVIDCMNYWQWLVIAQILKGNGISSSTSTTMAFIPSITAWSRQALFRGDKPDLSEDNSKESVCFVDAYS